jgi:hypothetical protein
MTETRLTRLTLVAVAVFAPVEGYASWEMLGGARALIHPAYLNVHDGRVWMALDRRDVARCVRGEMTDTNFIMPSRDQRDESGSA